ncbi:hypothetical protein AOLI_G00017960 [Acnodon oligacanthus]
MNYSQVEHDKGKGAKVIKRDDRGIQNAFGLTIRLNLFFWLLASYTSPTSSTSISQPTTAASGSQLIRNCPSHEESILMKLTVTKKLTRDLHICQIKSNLFV